MSNLQDRCGSVVIRLGGNTQEYAAMVPINSIPKGKSFSKADSGINTTVSWLPVSLLLDTIFTISFHFSQTQTPAVLYTIDMFYMMSNISKMLNVKWFLGMFISIHLNSTSCWRFIFNLRHPVQRLDQLEAYYRWKGPTDLRGQLNWSSSRQRTWFLRSVRVIIIYYFYSYLISSRSVPVVVNQIMGLRIIQTKLGVW